MNTRFLGRKVELSRTIKMFATGIILGFLISFRSETFSRFIAGTIGFSYLLGILGFFTENTSRVRAVILTAIFVIPLIIVQMTLYSPGFVCDLHAKPGYELKENRFTGEVKHNYFIGDRSCADLLPWYYEKLENRSIAEKEFRKYCEKDNSSEICGLGVEYAMRDAGYSG